LAIGYFRAIDYFIRVSGLIINVEGMKEDEAVIPSQFLLKFDIEYASADQYL